jgi:sigma-54 dependent transcriptional regulator, flagellar regulatory protein
VCSYLGDLMTDVNLEAQLDAMLIGSSQKMQQLRMLVKFAGRCNSSIMITGPSGSGKEVVANAIHSISQRASNPNITVNCGALPEQLVESELFGHEKGSFTGAINKHVGLFEQSNSGTIFLDEIGDMPLNMQVKLLRVLETRIVNRVGGNENIPIDVRVIAATHKNLGDAIQNNSFREDLFYRLCVVPIEVPALCERTEDIPALVDHFLKNQTETNPLPIFSAEAYAALQQYQWPGNVRELRNVVERAGVFFSGQTVLAQDIAMLIQSDIATAMQNNVSPEMNTVQPAGLGNAVNQQSNDMSFIRQTPFERTMLSLQEQQSNNVNDLNAHLQNEERRIIEHALQTSHGVVSRAARSINIKRTTFIDKMHKYDIAKQIQNGNVIEAAL